MPILAEAGFSECARTSECAQELDIGMIVFFGIFAGLPLLLAVTAIVYLLFRIRPRRR